MFFSVNSERNPYRPGAALEPLFLAGRDKEQGEFDATLRGAPEIPACIRMTGLRGVGKTVLLKEFERRAEQAGWAVIRCELEPRHNTEASLRTLLSALLDKSHRDLSRLHRLGESVRTAAVAAMSAVTASVGEVTFGLDPALSESTEELASALLEGSRFAVERGRLGLVLLLDEAQVLRDDRKRDGEHPLSMLVAAASALQQRAVPLATVLCGLPTLRAHLLDARTYSERMFRGIDVGSLQRAEAKEAFLHPLRSTSVSASPLCVTSVMDAVAGYPYFVQLWGAELWDAAQRLSEPMFTPQLLEAIEPRIIERLDRDFYEGRMDVLTAAMDELVMSAAECNYPPLLVSELRRHTTKSPGNVNNLIGRLVEHGLIYRTKKGTYEFTAPQFHEFLKRRATAI
jgi:hypothetical protein